MEITAVWDISCEVSPWDNFDPGKFIFRPTMENYASIIKNAHILDYFANSAVVSVVSTFVSLVIGSFAAYGFARFNFK